jgi:GntR family transcriptional regulator
VKAININFRSGLPIYVQIIEQVEKQVLQGELQPGDQLPTVRQLAAELRVNFNTIARAYRLLDEVGLISTQQGRGTYILERPSVEDQEKLRREALSALTRRYLYESARLGFSPAEIRSEIDSRASALQAGSDEIVEPEES